MENLEMKNTGGLQSEPDYRSDIIASSLASVEATNVAPLPPKLATLFFREKGGVLMQDKTPACVSHMVAHMMRLWYFLKTGTLVSFCPRFLHILSGMPKYNGGWQAGPEDGRSPAVVLKIAMNFGCPTIETMQNLTLLDNATYMNPAAITPAMFSEALRYKIPGYVPVTVSQQSFRQAIKTYGIVGMVARIGAEYWTNAQGKGSWSMADIDPLRAPTISTGGHAIAGIGWDSDIERLLNCWSTQWADNGETDYLWNEWSGHIYEGWAISEVPGAALEAVQGLPAPREYIHNFQTALSRGMQGPEIRALQIALSIDGEATYPEINGVFGPLTAQAVSLFQVKYAADILAPQGLTAPTGRVGNGTLKKLNELFNK